MLFGKLMISEWLGGWMYDASVESFVKAFEFSWPV